LQNNKVIWKSFNIRTLQPHLNGIVISSVDYCPLLRHSTPSLYRFKKIISQILIILIFKKCWFILKWWIER
jgi:hypothetical protein